MAKRTPKATAPEPDEAEATSPVARFSIDDLGRYVAEDGTRDLFITIGGQRFAHVCETPSGQWVYERCP